MDQKFSDYSPIETKRLYLREPRITDRETVFFIRTDLELNKYIKRVPPKSLKEVDTFINDRLRDRETSTAIYWVLTLKDFPDQYIGAISLWHFSKDKKTAEVGYDLHSDYHGKGFMSEALKAVIEFGFKTLHLDVIEAYTHIENVASRKLLEHHRFTLTTKKDIGIPMNTVYTLSQ